MASINRLKRELLLKIVFYGPGLGGKTTTLQHVHATTRRENRGEIVSLATDTDRTLYFDFLPITLLKVGDMTAKLQLYTVPGQVHYAATRKLVLRGADGVVFVADSQAARLDANLESLDDLNDSLAEQGRKLSSIPHVLQYNKRDLPDLVSIGELDRRLNVFGAPSLETVATKGHGLFRVLEEITRLVADAYRRDVALGRSKPAGPLFGDTENSGLADAVRELADSNAVEPSPGAGRLTTPAPQMAQRASFSLAEPWPPADREMVEVAELLLAKNDAAGAISACEDLLARVLCRGCRSCSGSRSVRATLRASRHPSRVGGNPVPRLLRRLAPPRAQAAADSSHRPSLLRIRARGALRARSYARVLIGGKTRGPERHLECRPVQSSLIRAATDSSPCCFETWASAPASSASRDRSASGMSEYSTTRPA